MKNFNPIFINSNVDGIRWNLDITNSVLNKSIITIIRNKKVVKIIFFKVPFKTQIDSIVMKNPGYITNKLGRLL